MAGLSMRKSRAGVIAAILIAVAAPASADFAMSLALQMRLKQDGFYKGEVDGRFGPASRRAMDMYAADRGISANRSAVFEQMTSAARSHRMEISDELREAGIESVKERLMDPYSADFKIEWAYPADKNMTIVCGRVNAKNSYGAYTGFKWFSISVTRVETLDASKSVYIGGLPIFEDIGATEMCLIATYIGAGEWVSYTSYAPSV